MSRLHSATPLSLPGGGRDVKPSSGGREKPSPSSPPREDCGQGEGGLTTGHPSVLLRAQTVPCAGICFRALFPYQNVGSLLFLYKSCAASLLGRAPPFRGGTWKGYVSLPRPTTLPAENTATPLACGQALGGECLGQRGTTIGDYILWVDTGPPLWSCACGLLNGRALRDLVPGQSFRALAALGR